MNKLVCDVLIFGAGIIGLSLALRLAQSGIKIIIVDNKNPDPINTDIVPNIRVSAINYASVEFFKKINVWQNLSSKLHTSYYQVETWEWSSAILKFTAESIGLSRMGCIIENNYLKLKLWKHVEDSKTIKLYSPVTLISSQYQNMFWKCIFSNKISINSRLLIGADGTYSQIREKLGIKVTRWKFNQCCMLLTIKTEKCNSGVVWQVFTPHGPVGFLPLYDRWGSLMWFDTPENIQKLQNLSAKMLESKIENSFYDRLGKVVLYNTFVTTLINQYAHSYIAPNGALVGDAAHTIHPMVGQGLNLGIRDVISLSELLIDSNIFSESLDNLENILISYHKSRRLDMHTMQFCINFLYFIFNNNLFPLKIVRNAAFITIEHFFYIKKQILKYATGI